MGYLLHMTGMVVADFAGLNAEPGNGAPRVVACMGQPAITLSNAQDSSLGDIPFVVAQSNTASLRLPPMVVQTMPLRAQLGLICSRSPATPPTGCSCGWVTNTEEGD